jgi:hypothetical protein
MLVNTPALVESVERTPALLCKGMDLGTKAEIEVAAAHSRVIASAVENRASMVMMNETVLINLLHYSLY